MTERREKPLIDGADDEADQPSAPPSGGTEEGAEGAPTAPNDDVPFEGALEELETIVEELEDGELGLEDAMDRFERGLKLVKACRSKLQQAELKVEELMESGETRELEE